MCLLAGSYGATKGALEKCLTKLGPHVRDKAFGANAQRAYEIRLKNRPVGMPIADDFELATVELPKPEKGQIQVRNIWMSVDPYMRGRMNDARSYVPPFALGAAMQGDAIGEVLLSDDPSFNPGDLVQSMFGWREAFNASANKVPKLRLTAYRPKPS